MYLYMYCYIASVMSNLGSFGSPLSSTPLKIINGYSPFSPPYTNLHCTTVCTCTYTSYSDPENEVEESSGNERPSPDSYPDSGGFQAIPPDWDEGGSRDSKDSTSSLSLLWSRVEELPHKLREKVVALREERYAVCNEVNVYMYVHLHACIMTYCVPL